MTVTSYRLNKLFPATIAETSVASAALSTLHRNTKAQQPPSHPPKIIHSAAGMTYYTHVDLIFSANSINM